MYQPANTKTLEELPPQQIRLGVQGYGGVGKTYSALTFPNIIVADLDRGLGAHAGRKDVIQVPFFDEQWCKKFNPNHRFIKDTFLLWMEKEGKKLEEDQTLLIDNITQLDEAYHKWYANNPVYTKQGKEDEFAEYRLKLDFFGDVTQRLISLRCNVIALSHEFEKVDKLNESTGKIRPLMSGQFANKLSSKFTDWFRQHASSKPKLEKVDDKVLKNWGMKNIQEFQAMLDTFPRDTIYYWQLDSDDIFDGKCSSLVNYPKYLPANYENFKRFMKPSQIHALTAEKS